ncbi:MAG: hypothetical protein ACFFDT_22685 [Candidatus Hodarchaeota archaeon]
MQLTKLAQRALDRVEAGEDINEIQDELGFEWGCSDGFWFGITDGGYIDPKEILVGEDLERVQEALETLIEFEKLMKKISPEF